MADPASRWGLREWGLVLLGVAVIVVTAAAWLQRPADLTRSEAVTAAEGAFAAAGLESAEVDPEPTRGTYDGSVGDPIEVWQATGTLDDGTVELWLARTDGEPVYLDDRTPDGARQLLTDEQFDAIADHDDNPALDRQIRRNLLVTLAAAAIVAVLSVVLAVEHRPARAPEEHL